jgi:phosphoserine aminotransferase
MSPVWNFNAGPAKLPGEVLEQVRAELCDYAGTGMSVMELSHRSKEFEAINSKAEANFKKLLGVGAGWRVLFMQGGASQQFTTVPMNFLPAGKFADYIVTGTWGEKAVEEVSAAQLRIAAKTQEGGYRRVPTASEIRLGDAPAYVHLTTNETIQGVQWHQLPDVGDVPLIADMSSDILSRPYAYERFSLIYAGAQKNLGPSGVTAVAIRESFLEKAQKTPPTMLRYQTHAKNNSLYNTPPTFGVYMLGLVLEWIEKNGGLAGLGQRNAAKAKAIYDVIDNSGGFYRGHAEVDSRSQMNVTFRLGSEEQEKKFLAEASKAGMVGLAGHRSVGGIRASIYNAVQPEACASLAELMRDFAKRG